MWWVDWKFSESIRSYFASSTKENLQEDDDFVNRKRTNEDARELYGTKIFNKNVLVQLSSVFYTDVRKEEHGDWCSVIEKVSHIKEARLSEMAHDVTLSAPKADNPDVQKTRADFALLLEGNI